MYKNFFAVFMIISLFFPYSAMAEEEDTESNVSISGYVKTDNRMRLENENDYENEFSFQEYRLDLKVDAEPGENLHVFSEVWLRSIGSSDVSESSDLSDKDKISPWNLDMREAYVDVYGFVFDNLDLRIGRQRIAWGTGDNLNPTDNLNPDDLEDIWDFGRHLGSDAIKLTYYAGDLSITGVYIPTFRPAVLPRGEWASALTPEMELPTSMSLITLNQMSDTVNLPENNYKKSSVAGAKAAMKIFNLDLSLSYVYGRDDIPIVNRLTITPTSIPLEVDVNAELMYPRFGVAGADLSVSIFDIGLWAESATFFPEKITMVTDLSALGFPNQEIVLLDDEKPYTKYVIGFDYTFKNGLYINSQYLHGFIHERGNENLEDYILLGIEYKMFNDKIKIIPIQGGVEIKDFDDIKENYAVIYSPQIIFYPYDNVEITLAANIIDGKDTTTFGKVKDLDEVMIKVKGSF